MNLSIAMECGNMTLKVHAVGSGANKNTVLTEAVAHGQWTNNSILSAPVYLTDSTDKFPLSQQNLYSRLVQPYLNTSYFVRVWGIQLIAVED